MRIDKFLSDCGVGSRREVKALLKSGAVKINGTAVESAAAKVDENCDTVTLNGEKIIYKKFVYLMLNKPAGCVSAVYDKRLPVVTDFVGDEYRHFGVFPVGRLDIDTEGLLLLTNDGALTHRLLSPKNHVPKKYFVKTALPVTADAVRALKNGITLGDGTIAMPASVEIASANECFLTIYEGKFHQVKRMFAAAGNTVVYLKRVQMGALELDESLSPGETRELFAEELAKLIV